MGPNCHFYPTSRVWAPWNLITRTLIFLSRIGAVIFLQSRAGPSQFSRHSVSELIPLRGDI